MMKAVFSSKSGCLSEAQLKKILITSQQSPRRIQDAVLDVVYDPSDTSSHVRVIQVIREGVVLSKRYSWQEKLGIIAGFDRYQAVGPPNIMLVADSFDRSGQMSSGLVDYGKWGVEPVAMRQSSSMRLKKDEEGLGGVVDICRRSYRAILQREGFLDSADLSEQFFKLTQLSPPFYIYAVKARELAAPHQHVTVGGFRVILSAEELVAEICSHSPDRSGLVDFLPIEDEDDIRPMTVRIQKSSYGRIHVAFGRRFGVSDFKVEYEMGSFGSNFALIDRLSFSHNAIRRLGPEYRSHGLSGAGFKVFLAKSTLPLVERRVIKGVRYFVAIARQNPRTGSRQLLRDAYESLGFSVVGMTLFTLDGLGDAIPHYVMIAEKDLVVERANAILEKRLS